MLHTFSSRVGLPFLKNLQPKRPLGNWVQSLNASQPAVAFGAVRFGDGYDSFEPPRWSKSPFFKTKRQEYFDDHLAYSPGDIKKALENERELQGLIPRIVSRIDTTDYLQGKLKGAREAIEAQAVSTTDVTKAPQPKEAKICESETGELWLSQSPQAQWTLEFRSTSDNTPRYQGAKYKATVPLLYDNAQFRVPTLNDKAPAGCGWDAFIQVVPKTLKSNQFILLTPNEQANGSDEKSPAGSIHDLGIWEPFLTLQKATQTLSAMHKLLLENVNPSAPSPPPCY